MTCKQCHNFKQCMAEAVTRNQVFDPEYDGEHGCAAKQFSPMTNADRLRAMSDEKLAEYLCALQDCASCKVIDLCDMRFDGNLVKDAADGFKKYLKQPAPVVYGHVLDNGNPICGPCSTCGDSVNRRARYCSMWGARMDGE